MTIGFTPSRARREESAPWTVRGTAAAIFARGLALLAAGAAFWSSHVPSGEMRLAAPALSCDMAAASRSILACVTEQDRAFIDL